MSDSADVIEQRLGPLWASWWREAVSGRCGRAGGLKVSQAQRLQTLLSAYAQLQSAAQAVVTAWHAPGRDVLPILDRLIRALETELERPHRQLAEDPEEPLQVSVRLADTEVRVLSVASAIDLYVPEMFGQPSRVSRLLGIGLDSCPVTRHGHLVRHYHLDGPVRVCECPVAGFLWYRRDYVEVQGG